MHLVAGWRAVGDDDGVVEVIDPDYLSRFDNSEDAQLERQGFAITVRRV